MKWYRGEIKVILKQVFDDFPDSYAVNGVNWIGAPKLTPWCYVTNPLGKLYTCRGDWPTGVVITSQQLDKLEMLYATRFNSRLRYVLEVYDKNRNPDIPCTNYQ